MAQKCVHKGCGKRFDDPEEECTYHPGPPVFHEGQKGWQCCKPRFLTFDEFLAIPPCTTGKHSTVDDTPQPAPAPATSQSPEEVPTVESAPKRAPQRPPQPAPLPAKEVAPPEPESESDVPGLPITQGLTCRRRGCEAKSTEATASSREGEDCVHHPGHPIFHEGSKGWTCCKRRVLEFDEFMRITGCAKKERHMFVGSGKKGSGEQSSEKALTSIKHDFYQTGTSVHASFYLKKISKTEALVRFLDHAVELDLPTADKTRYKETVPLYGSIDPEKSTSKIMGTKLEVTLVKTDGTGWPVLRGDEKTTGEIIQTGRAGVA